MASRLPPGEAERRKRERARRLWSGEIYEQVAPGNPKLWADLAAAFVNGDSIFLEEARTFTAKPFKKTTDTRLMALRLDEMPVDAAGLTKGYRFAVMAAFREANFSDTSLAYVTAFRTITEAYHALKTRHGW